MTGPSRWRAGLLLLSVLLLPPVVSALEARLLTHLVVQMPLLVLSGLWISSGLEPLRRHPLVPGPATSIAIAIALFWMLPRSMDAVLEHRSVDALKFACLVFGVGVPLGVGWRRLSSVARGFLLGNAISMLVVLGWLYTSAPTRVCNFYLLGDQARTGHAFLALAATLGALSTLRSFGLSVSSLRPRAWHRVSGRSQVISTLAHP